MSSKQLIRYENLHCRVNFKWKTVLKDDFEIIDLKDIERERRHCYGEDQYIKNFIEVMKERVIRKLPELNKVKIMLGVFDKNKVMHRLMVATFQMLCKILKIEKKINLYKSIIVMIEYEGQIVFNGSLSFDGI
jgi:hypothetical protein